MTHTATNQPAQGPAAAVPPGERLRRRGGARGWVRAAGQAAAAILAAGLFGFGYFTGTLGTVLGGVALGGAVLAVVSRALGVRTGALETALLRGPWRRTPRSQVAQLLNRLIFWPLVGVAAGRSVTAAAVAPTHTRVGEIIGWAAIGVLMLSALVPRRRIMVVSNAVMLVTSAFLAVQFVRLATPVTGSVALDSPLRGDWYVASGGRSVLFNHHYPVSQQRHALDLAIARTDREGSTDPRSYPAFGKTVYAPADGTAITVRDDLADLPVGTADRVRPLGNHVVLQIGQDRFVLMAHLQQHSVTVTTGQQVRRGEPVGRVGNSGNTSEPHLHIQVQDRPALLSPDGRHWTRDLHTFPIEMRGTTRTRGGDRSSPARDLRRNDMLHTPAGHTDD